MKKQFFSLALFAVAWLVGNPAQALVQDEDGYYLIGSKADLQAWKEISDYEATNAKLTDDIDGVDFMLCDGSPSFTGTFDGQGHTITLNLEVTKKYGALFFNFAGTLKNVIIGGKIVARNENCSPVAGYSWSANSRMENVISIATIEVEYTKNVSNGGLLGCTKYNITFMNCVSAVKVTGNQGYNHGFVGWMTNGVATIKNSISIMDIDASAAATGSCSWGNPATSSRISVSNSYSVKTSADNDTPTWSNVYATVEQMASGYVAYNINTAAGSNVLFQTLGSDNYPVPFSTHGTVYASGHKHCDLTDYEGVTYNNTSDETNIDDHDYNSNFRCNYCGIYYTDYKTPDGEGYYELGTVDDVKWFAGMVNEEHQTTIKGKLTADIDYQGVENAHTPIGLTTTYKYNGIFDGQGHRIKKMIIKSTTNEQGFFGIIRGGTIIRNLIIDSSCSVTGAARIGGLVGSAQVNTGSPIIIENCINEASIEATGAAGGILGAAQGSDYPAIQISNCLNTGEITGSPATAFCSWNNRGDSSLTNCANLGTINGADNAGNKFSYYCQLIRYEPNTLTITNCYDLSGFDDNGDGCQGTKLDYSAAASGELCYKLGAAFTQDLGTEDLPTFGSKQVILNGSYENVATTLTLNDANSFGTNSDFDVTSVTMTRTLKGEKWNTFCVPFDMEISELGTGAEVKELTGATPNGENYNMTFSDAISIVAGKPYMVRVPNEVTSLNLSNKTIKGTITPATAGDVTFTGVYNNGNAPQGSFIISNNVFYNVDSTVALKAFRGYITVDSGSGVKALTFDFDDDATGISLMEDGRSQMEDGAIYNIAGQRLDNSQFTIHNSQLKRGIYIVNGKKILK